MKLEAKLLDKRNGNIFVHTEDLEPDLAEGAEWLWSDGNFACDCNRSLFMYRDNEAMQLNCGDDTIVLLELKIDERVVLKENCDSRA